MLKYMKGNKENIPKIPTPYIDSIFGNMFYTGSLKIISSPNSLPEPELGPLYFSLQAC